MTVAAQIQAEATIVSLANDIDALYVLDQQYKALEAQIKALKADIANKYDEGDHKGELHSVTVKMVAVKGTVDYAKLCVAYGIQDDVLDTYRKAGRADIRVTSNK